MEDEQSGEGDTLQPFQEILSAAQIILVVFLLSMVVIFYGLVLLLVFLER